jgi:hypothetical protein
MNISMSKDCDFADINNRSDQKEDSSSKKTLPSTGMLTIKLLGARGMIGIITVIAVGGLMLYAYFLFARPPWYVLSLAIAAFSLPLLHVYQLNKTVKKILKSTFANENTANNNNNDYGGGDDEHTNLSCARRSYIAMKHVGLYYDNIFNPNGKYYLIKTYVSEVFEYIFQIVAIFVYNCNFPIFVVVIIYFVLLFEVVVVGIDTVWTIKYGITVERRNNKVMLDIVLEFLSASVPNLILFFAYGLAFTTDEFISLAIVPAIFCLSKLYDIVDATILEKEVLYTKFYNQKNLKVRGLTFFESWSKDIIEDENGRIAKQQMRHTPRSVHFIFLIILFMYGLFLCALIIVHLLQFTTPKNLNCTNETSSLWKGCEVKVYFCDNIFQPKCNCAILNINRHNITKLPKSLFKMNALKSIHINNGPLSYLENDIRKLNKLKLLNLNYNSLKTIPATISSIKLDSLSLANNNLKWLPLSIWGSVTIRKLELDNNNILRIPYDVIGNAKSLTHLFLSNNTLTKIPVQLFNLKLVALNLDGNHLKSIPKEIGKTRRSLKTFSLQNNNIEILPAEIGDLERLYSLDLRNNSISYFPKEINSLGRQLKYLYVYGNPICSNDWKNGYASERIKQLMESKDAGCSKQCSPYCKHYLLDRKRCLRDCNSKTCNFQNGVCA